MAKMSQELLSYIAVEVSFLQMSGYRVVMEWLSSYYQVVIEWWSSVMEWLSMRSQELGMWTQRINETESTIGLGVMRSFS